MTLLFTALFERTAMLRCYQYLIILLICLYPFFFTAFAEEDPEDMVDIFESDGEVIAVIEGKNTKSLRLRTRETVLWSDAKGYLGGFLTNYRFFIISTSSGGWQELPLRKEEARNASARLSPYLALLATADRAVGFDTMNGKFIEARLPIHEKPVTTELEGRVALVVTPGRAYGLASGSHAFTPIRLRLREVLKTIKITSGKAVIQTSDRLLSFEASGATWNEYQLN